MEKYSEENKESWTERKRKNLRMALKFARSGLFPIIFRIEKQSQFKLPHTTDNWKYPIPPSLENDQVFPFKRVKTFKKTKVLIERTWHDLKQNVN